MLAGRSDTHTRRVTGLRCVLAYNEFVKDTLFCGRNHERQCGRCAKIYIWLRVKKKEEKKDGIWNTFIVTISLSFAKGFQKDG